MGPGTIVDAARAAGAGANLRAWGDVLGSAADDVVRGMRGESPVPVAEGVAGLVPVTSGTVRATGWELRGAFAWRNDDRCVQRAAFGVMSLLEREAGGIRPAMGELASADARRGAIAVNYSPNFQSSIGRARLHAAPVFRTTEGEALVIDHLVAGADDGVLTLEEWMRRTGGTAASTYVVHPLHMPPLSPKAHAGIPARSVPHAPAQWRDFGSHLAASWDEAALHQLPQLQPLR